MRGRACAGWPRGVRRCRSARAGRARRARCAEWSGERAASASSSGVTPTSAQRLRQLGAELVHLVEVVVERRGRLPDQRVQGHLGGDDRGCRRGRRRSSCRCAAGSHGDPGAGVLAREQVLDVAVQPRELVAGRYSGSRTARSRSRRDTVRRSSRRMRVCHNVRIAAAATPRWRPAPPVSSAWRSRSVSRRAICTGSRGCSCAALRWDGR